RASRRVRPPGGRRPRTTPPTHCLRTRDRILTLSQGISLRLQIADCGWLRDGRRWARRAAELHAHIGWRAAREALQCRLQVAGDGRPVVAPPHERARRRLERGAAYR